MWVLLALVSALCLGVYDVSKKEALRVNDVAQVLIVNVLICSAILCVPLLLSRVAPDWMEGRYFYVPEMGARAHLLTLLKSAIVLSSWVCSYIALKHLPISVCAPAQATRPVWTLLGAIVLFGERLNGWQTTGVLLAVAGAILLAFSAVETKGQGTRSTKRVYYLWLALAIITGSASGLYDKYMMRQFDHNAVQVYYTLYQLVLLVLYGGVKFLRESIRSVHWSPALVLVSVMLVLSDNVYMLALRDPDSLIAVVSCCRRSGVLIGFAYGLLVLHEGNALRKWPAMLATLLALICLAAGSV